MDKNDLQQELRETPIWNLTGRTQGVIAREIQKKERDIRAKEKEFEKIYTELWFHNSYRCTRKNTTIYI
jgi:hypothetical protein